MKNVYKFFIVLFSVAFISSGVFAQISNLDGEKKFNEDQLKLLKKSGLTDRDLDTKVGMEKAGEVLNTYYANKNFNPPPKSSTSSKSIKNPDASVTITIGTETNTTTGFNGTNITPFGTWYQDGQNQYLYTAYELGIAGVGAGDITEIGWHVSEAAADVMNGFNIEVKHTTAYTTTEFEADFTNVYSGTYVADTGWNMFTFTEPFLYDGVSSLLVKVCFDNEAYIANSHVYYSVTTNPMNAYAYNDYTAGCSDPYQGSILERPNTRITGEEMLNPPPGIPFNEIPISGTFEVPVDGDVTWSFGDNTETYSVWFGPEGAMELVLDNQAVPGLDGIYTYTGLEYASIYQWQVIAMNANATTNGPIWVFSTECATVTAPYTETFTLWPPICWDMTGGTSDWQHYTTGVECAMANFWGQQIPNNDIMTTPPIENLGTNLGLEFLWSHTYNATYPTDSLVVYISDDDGVSWTDVWAKGGVELESNDGAGNTNPGTFISSDIISLSGFGSPIKAQFIGYSGWGPNLFIDDVKVFEVAYGALDGTISDLASTNPIEGAVLKVGLQTDTTDVNGMYSFAEVLVGPQMIYCSAYGHNDTVVETTIVVGETTTLDIAMTAPTMDIASELNVTVPPFGVITDYIDVVNNGNGPLMWTVVLDTVGSGNDMWLSVTQFSGTVEAGETEQVQLDFDANTIVAGTVLTGTMSFTSDPEVGEVVVDITFTVGAEAFGHYVGNVFLDGIAPYNMGDVTEVLIEAGPYSTNPETNGDYDLEAYPGTYDVIATLYGYETQTAGGVVLPAGGTETVDFTMPCLYGKVSGTVTAVEGGGFIEGATVIAVGTEVETMTDVNGYYEMFVEAGENDIKVSVVGYASETATVTIEIQADVTQDFILETLAGIIVVIDLDPTPNEEITDVIQSFFPEGLVVYTTAIDEYPLNEEVLSVFLLLGIYSSNYVLSEDDAIIITTWLEGYDDRGLYMEGGDTWAYNAATSLHAKFNITGVADGGDDLTNVEGLESYWGGFSWTYAGENNFIDHLEAIDPAINVTQNPDIGYFNTVAYDAGTYKTVGASYEITGLDDGTGSFAMGVACVLGYFGYPVFTYGELEGYVTVLDGGAPVEDAEISVGGLGTTTTDENGYYYFPELLTGSWTAYCTIDGYNQLMAEVLIEEDLLTVADFELTAPVLEFDPGTIAVTLEPNQQANESLVISNTGNGPIDWTANLSFAAENSDDVGDIVYELAIGNITGETQTFGAEWDGIHLWTTGGNTFLDPNQLYQFDFDGNLVAQFDQPLDGSSSGIRDLAFDGTYLYGGNESAFYMIDPADGAITELFTNNFGQTITALAWVPVFNAFYSKNQGSDMIKFDIDGNLLETIPVTGADNVTGAAWDNSGNKLWLFNKSGSPQSTFLEYDIVSKQLTGVTQQVETVGGSSGQESAGAFYATDMVPGFAVLGGSTQGSPNMAFAMEIEGSSTSAWIGIDLQSGSLNPGEDITMEVAIDATDLLPAVYEADIVFTSDPYMGDIVVPVALTVEGLIPPIGLFAYYECTDVYLIWDIPGGTPLSFNIYQNGDLIGNVNGLEYTLIMVEPNIELCYTVTAVYNEGESQPSAESCLTVPLPENLEITFIEGWGSSDTAYIVWDAPEACVMADEFNVYRDNVMIGSTVDTFYHDINLAADFYQYHVTAVYYFGESENSEIVPILIVSLDENKLEGLVVSPNPAIDYVKVNSGIHVNAYTLMDINGKVVESNIVESSNFTIDVSQYNAGLYYLRFETDDKPLLRKIILK